MNPATELVKPLRGPALSEAIRDYIKEYILTHHLQPGDQLPPEPLTSSNSSLRLAVTCM